MSQEPKNTTTSNPFVYGSTRLSPEQIHRIRALAILKEVFGSEAKIPAWAHDIASVPVYNDELMVNKKLQSLYTRANNRLRAEAYRAGVLPKKPHKPEYREDQIAEYARDRANYEAASKLINQTSYRILTSACAWLATPEEVRQRIGEYFSQGPRNRRKRISGLWREQFKRVRKTKVKVELPKIITEASVPVPQPYQPPLTAQPRQDGEDDFEILRPGDSRRVVSDEVKNQDHMMGRILARMREMQEDDELILPHVEDDTLRKRMFKNIYNYARRLGWGNQKPLSRVQAEDGRYHIVRNKTT